MHICTISAFNIASLSHAIPTYAYITLRLSFSFHFTIYFNMGIITDFNLAGVEHSASTSHPSFA